MESEEQKQKIKKSEQNLRDLWDTMKHTNRYIMRVLEEKRQREGVFKEIMVKHPKFDEIHESTTARIHKFITPRSPVNSR